MYRNLQFSFCFLVIISMQTVYTKMIGVPLDELFFISCNFLLFTLIYIGKIKIGKSVFIIWNIFLFTLIINLFFRFFVWKENYNLWANIIIVYMFTFFLFLCLMYFSKYENISLFFRDFENIMFYISLISLIFFVIGQSYYFIRPTSIVTVSWGGIKQLSSWFFIHFNAQGQAYGFFSHGRNTGIYVEAPQFAFMISVALTINLFITKKTSVLKTIVFLVTVLTTYSTTGQIVTLFLFVVKFVSLKVSDNRVKIIKSLALIILSSISLYLIFALYESKKSFGNSYEIRNYNLSKAIENFFYSPIFGIGFKADSVEVGNGNTSTFTQILQEGGLSFFILYFASFVMNLFKSMLKKKFIIFFAILTYLILLYPTVMTYTQLSVVILSISICYCFNKNPCDNLIEYKEEVENENLHSNT